MHDHHSHYSVFDGDCSRWDASWAQLACSLFALEALAQEDAEIGRIASRVRASVNEWHQLDEQRRQLRGSALAASARTKVADAALDHRIDLLAQAIIATEGGRESERYKELFPEPHEAVIALGLDAEIPAATLLLSKLNETKSTLLEPHIKPLRGALQVGHAALSQRGEIYGALGMLQARVEAWFDGTASLRTHVRSALELLAKERSLPARWVAALAGD